MHPNSRFGWDDRGEMLAFLDRLSFCTIVVGDSRGLAVAHAPVTVVDDGAAVQFHVSRANVAAPRFDGVHGLLSCIGPHGYISPDWYGTDDQVPTWNYVAVECEGPIRRMNADEGAALLDRLGALHEAALLPKAPWTRGKMSPGRFDAMLNAIICFEMRIEALRGTRKLGQTKSAGETRNVVAALRAAGRDDLAAAMEQAS